MNHIELGKAESAAASYVSPYERWANRVEAILGFSLDGTQWEDGYSLDWALECFNEGMNSRDFAERVRQSIASLKGGR